METLARAANRGSIATGAGYEIDNSFVQEYNSTRRVSMYYGGFGGSAPTNTKATISFWFKWAGLNGGGANWKMIDTQNSQFGVMPEGGTYDSAIYCAGQNESLFKLVSTAKFRDTSAWYHMCAVFDSTLSTASDRVKIYVNGVRVTDFTTANYPAQNASFRHIGENTTHHVGHDVNIGKPYAYYADMYYIFDQAKDVTDFGEFDEDTGIWKPIEYTGTFGSYGYYWDFSNASNYAEDQSGTASGTSQMTEQSLSTTTAMQATDTPTNNFATLNPLVTYYGSATINEGATKIQGTSTSSFETVYSTMAVTSGKWYFEIVNLLGSTRNTIFGIVNLDTATFDGTAYNSAGFWLGNMDTGGQIYYYENGVATGNESITFSQGDIIGIAFDADNGTLDFYLNNSNQEQFTGIPSGTFAFIVEVQGTGAPYIQANFGGYTTISISSAVSDANGYGTFEYAPPSGYYAMCTKNLSEFG